MSKTTVAICVVGFASFAGLMQAQGLTEFGAVAGGAAVGGAAGKAASVGLSRVLGNLEKQTAEAAGPPAPELEVGPPEVKTTLETVKTKSRLPEAPLKDRAVGKPGSSVLDDAPILASFFQLPTPPEFLTAIPTLASVIPSPAPLPPPEMTNESFKQVTAGMNRSDLLHMGMPAFKVTMDEDGHLVEIYTYHQAGAKIGTVRLTDGAVASVRP